MAPAIGKKRPALLASPDDTRKAIEAAIFEGRGLAHFARGLQAKTRGRPKKWDAYSLEEIAEVYRLGRVLLAGETKTIQHRNRPRPERKATQETPEQQLKAKKLALEREKAAVEDRQLERGIRARLEGKASRAAALEAGIRRYMVRLIVKKGGTLTDHEIGKWVKAWAKRLSDHRKQRP